MMLTKACFSLFVTVSYGIPVRQPEFRRRLIGAVLRERPVQPEAKMYDVTFFSLSWSVRIG
jgi:hypothetical protein